MKAKDYLLRMALASLLMGFTFFITQATAGTIDVRILGGQTEADRSDNDAEQHLGYEDTDDMGNPINFGGMEGNKSSDLELGANRPPPDPRAGTPGNGPQLIGLRWLDINIPAGSTVTNAFIQFKVNEPDKSPPDVPANLTISGEKDLVPAAYDDSQNFNISMRPETTSKVMWNDIPVWAFIDINQGGICVGCGDEGPDQRTPDLSSIIQEIIDQPGWASGNPIALMVAPQTANFNRTANSWESGDSNGPDPPNQGALLHIEFVPEPTSLAIVTLGMLSLLAVGRRRFET